MRFDPDRYVSLIKYKYACLMAFTGRAMKGILFIQLEGVKRIDSLKYGSILLVNLSTLTQKN